MVPFVSTFVASLQLPEGSMQISKRIRSTTPIKKIPAVGRPHTHETPSVQVALSILESRAK